MRISYTVPPGQGDVVIVHDKVFPVASGGSWSVTFVPDALVPGVVTINAGCVTDQSPQSYQAYQPATMNLVTTGIGYVLVTADNQVSSLGDSPVCSLPSTSLRSPVVGAAMNPWTGTSIWVAGADGTVDGGDGPYGSARTAHLAAPIVGMAATPTGNGYWLVGQDGGVFSFGDAHFFGSTGALRLNQPMVGIAPTPTGNGYVLVARDGGVFTFGDASFYGSTGGLRLAQPVVGIALSRTGSGYLLVARDGGVFTFGDAAFYGSAGSLPLVAPVTAVARTNTGNGYWLIAADGGVFSFGDASFRGASPAPPVCSILRPATSRSSAPDFVAIQATPAAAPASPPGPGPTW